VRTLNLHRRRVSVLSSPASRPGHASRRRVSSPSPSSRNCRRSSLHSSRSWRRRRLSRSVLCPFDSHRLGSVKARRVSAVVPRLFSFRWRRLQVPSSRRLLCPLQGRTLDR
ncbi:hypothetical protein PIB30_090265, partial [Stylosanthes scabra]|nr:hypothetical protein [Stylosanthes scabra]